MFQLRRLGLGITMVLGYLVFCSEASAVVLFADNFQSDTPVLSNSTADADPVIGAGDTGGIWQNTESPALAIQVENDTVPAQNGVNGSLIAGANNYLRVYRGGGSTSRGAAYGRNWSAAATQNKILNLTMQVYQVTGSSMSVFFGTTIPNTNVNSGVNAFATAAAVQLSLGPTLPDNQWNTVHVIANMSSTDTQWGIAPQSYRTFINNQPGVTAGFANAANQVPAMLFGLSETNETFNYLDDIVFQAVTTPEPASACVWAMVIGACGWFGWTKRKLR